MDITGDTTATPTKTLVTLLLDRSGSMQSAKDDTIGAVNAYLAGLRAGGSDIRFSLVLFDTDGPDMSLEKVHVARRIAEVPDLVPDAYIPRGSTPLIDAACTTIRAVAASLEGREAKPVIVIQTDGEENASRENSWADLKALVAEKERAGWDFVFMGCGIDAYAQGAQMGIAPDRTMAYRRAPAETAAAFEGLAEATVALAAAPAGRFEFLAQHKDRAGDDHARGWWGRNGRR
jgi:Mg-chelatase subunit ChlD